MKTLLRKLQHDYPQLTFVSATEFCWSPATAEILYNPAAPKARSSAWSLLHEVGHALSGHTHYESDFDLLNLETAAWQKAKQIGKTYGYDIDSNHIQDCLDSYRDWLHQRSACPNCDTRCLQEDNRQYRCFNCNTAWQVSSSRFCRPYRRVEISDKKETSPSENLKATFA